MHSKDAAEMANSVDPDQTAIEQSDLDLHFSQTWLSRYKGSVWAVTVFSSHVAFLKVKVTDLVYIKDLC